MLSLVVQMVAEQFEQHINTLPPSIILHHQFDNRDIMCLLSYIFNVLFVIERDVVFR